jgi:hypothetical protein
MQANVMKGIIEEIESKKHIFYFLIYKLKVLL